MFGGRDEGLFYGQEGVFEGAFFGGGTGWGEGQGEGFVQGLSLGCCYEGEGLEDVFWLGGLGEASQEDGLFFVECLF